MSTPSAPLGPASRPTRAHRKSGSRRCRHLPPATARSPRTLEEISGTAFPCREQGGAPGALRRLCVVRGRVPRGIREAEKREPCGVVSDRQLPLPAAVRGRVVRLTMERRVRALELRALWEELYPQGRIPQNRVGLHVSAIHSAPQKAPR